MRQIKTFAVLLLSSGAAYAADPVQTYSTRADQVSISSGAEREMMSACNGAIAQWAAQFDPVNVDMSMTAPVRVRPSGARMASLFVAVDYNRQGGLERRSANIECTVSADGSVAVAEIDPNQ